MRRESVDILRARVDALPAQLERTWSMPGPPIDVRAWSRSSVVVTGVGLAAGPARVTAHMLARAGVAARFEPIGAFAVHAPRAQALIVVSQGLSPNARIAMGRVGAYERALLITSQWSLEHQREVLATWRARSGRVWSIAPDEREDGMLLRVVGPACASYAAMRLATMFTGGESVDELERVPERVAGALERARELERALPTDGALTIVTCGLAGALTHGLAWKVMEGTWARAPLVTDIFDYAHGPLQATSGEQRVLMVCRGGREHDELVERLVRVAPAHHAIVECRAQSRGPAAMLEHDAALDAWLCRALAALGRDLSRWPAQGKDGALYEASESLVMRERASAS